MNQIIRELIRNVGNELKAQIFGLQKQKFRTLNPSYQNALLKLKNLRVYPMLVPLQFPVVFPRSGERESDLEREVTI